MKNAYKVLLIEDQPDDAKLIELGLSKSELRITLICVETIPDLKMALEQEDPDMVISDYNMGDFTGKETLDIVKGYSPDIPFILVSGYLGEEKAVEMMVSGAADVVKKDNLDRLNPVVERELLHYDEQKRQQEILKNAYSLAEIGHWEVDLETDIVNWSEEVMKIFEVDPDYVPTLEQAIKFYEKGYHRNHVRKLIKRAIQKGEKYQLDALITTAKGNKRWVRSVGKPKKIDEECVYLYGSVQNITKQKQISEKQKMLSKVASETQDAVIITDLNHQIEWVNDAFEKLTGYSFKEVKGKNPDLLQGPDSDPETVAYMHEMLEKRKEFTVEILNYTKTGDPYWVELDVSPMTDEKGNVVQFFSIQGDITEHKSFIERLKRKGKRLEEAQKIGKIGDWDFNVETGKIFWSDEMYEIYERDPSLGPPDYKDIFKYYQEDRDAKLHNKVVAKAIETGESYAEDLKICTEKGTEKYVHAEGHAGVDEKGIVYILHGIVQDITDRKQKELDVIRREKQLSAVTNNIEALIFRYVLMPDGSDEMNYVSDSIEKIYEVTAEQAMESTRIIWNQVFEKDVQGVKDSVQHSAESLTTWNHRFRICTPSGIQKWLHGRGNPTKHDDGSVQWDTVMLDVTDQMRREQLNETLVQEVHHRVKNNLAIIIGFLDLQLHDLPEDRWDRLPLERAITRIHSIADVHKLLYEGVGFNDVRVSDYLESLISHISSTMNLEQKIEFKIEAGDLQMNVNELTPMGMLINELITNSAKYAFIEKDQGSISINVSKEKDTYFVVYKDNGPGIEKATFEDAQTSGFNIIKILLAQLEADYRLAAEQGFGLLFSFDEKTKGAHGNVVV